MSHEINGKTQIQKLTEKAEQGCPIAQLELGTRYHNGQGFGCSDYKLAFEWFAKSASQGNQDAQYSLGYMYEMGYGIAHSYIQSNFWYKKAAEQRQRNVKNTLGVMTFGKALEHLKGGNKVARQGWNGKGMWITLEPAVDSSTPSETVHYLARIDMNTATGERCVGWLASQTDMLSDDWAVVEQKGNDNEKF